MSSYIIGDVQGCYVELQNLLELINYNPDRDQLGFVGDLVNRGPESAQVLRFIKQLRSPWVVLGNHDLYLLIIGYNLVPSDRYQHTLHNVLAAKDRFELLDFLRHQPLLFSVPEKAAALVHAGIPPQWNLSECLGHAAEVESALRGKNFEAFLLDLFGDEPASWNPNLQGQSRLRYITNALTRMRFCAQDGTLNFTKSLPEDNTDPHFKAWFEWPRSTYAIDILFGHWAMLGGRCDQPRCYALDTGCAWGQSLTALRLEDKKRFSVPAIIQKSY